jgi:hypothetical protein
MKVSLPEANVYWRDAIEPITDLGSAWIDANNRVCYWTGNEAGEAEATLKCKAATAKKKETT